MKPLKQFKNPIQFVFSDIDDTMTTDGKLPWQSYEMLWRLSQSGISVIPVTGRPAGWCEMIARFWPVAAIIGENGAFYFEYANNKMNRHFVIDEKTRKDNSHKLQKIETEVLKKVPGAALASDQFTRLFDLAIDFCEDVPRLPASEVQKIVSIFQDHGATAKVSSIHVNGWFGDYDKRTMCEVYYKNKTGKNLKENLQNCAFIGDSPNDEPLFAFFPNSFAVANLNEFKSQLKSLPAYITEKSCGDGFVEFGERLLEL